MDLPETQGWVYALKERELVETRGNSWRGRLFVDIWLSLQIRYLGSIKPDTGPDALGAQASYFLNSSTVVSFPFVTSPDTYKRVSIRASVASHSIMMIQSGNIRDPPVYLPRRVDWVTNVLDTADTSL